VSFRSGYHARPLASQARYGTRGLPAGRRQGVKSMHDSDESYSGVRGGPDFSKTALDLVLRTYDNHKNHARFQEQQRSWFFITYMTFSGVLISGIINNFQKDGYVIGSATPILCLILSFHAVISVLMEFMVSKVSREFRRHFRQAENIIEALNNIISQDHEEIRALLRTGSLGTSGDHHVGFRKFIAKRFGVAAMHNYIISISIGFDFGFIVYLTKLNIIFSVVSFVTSSVSAIGIFAFHNKIMDTA